jgi:hypothetical protein
VLHAFVYNETAILVRHWFEVSLKDSHLEHGVRLELRLRDPQPLRGSESAAQRIAVDQPVWRADLFDRVDGTPGAFEAAHYHPRFAGDEPSERNWLDEIKATPWEWLHGQLSDIAAVTEAGGVSLADPAADTEQIRADAPEIVAVARSRAGAHGALHAERAQAARPARPGARLTVAGDTARRVTRSLQRGSRSETSRSHDVRRADIGGDCSWAYTLSSASVTSTATGGPSAWPAAALRCC